MKRLELKFLGDLAVLRDGEPQPLPPSRKTRALLAYLALNDRRFRREQLCELLWEIPDDPRGSLRWSLSKLRRLVDDTDRPRIVADRTHVGMDSAGIGIDVTALETLAGNGLEDIPLAELEQAAEAFSGHFLEGLDLSNFHEFHTWWVAMRESVTRAQTRLLTTIVDRARSEPERALPFAQELVTLTPYDEQARAGLIGLLVGLGRTAEAEQQYEIGSRMLQEAGARPTGTLARALRGREPVEREAAPSPVTPEPSAPTTSHTLVGRDQELEQIAAVFRATRDTGTARVLVLRGEPGIGKSRLLEAAAAMGRDEGACVIEASAFESEAIRPFAIWIDGLRRHSPEAVERIFGGAAGENRERLFAGLGDFVADVAGNGMVVLVFDDLQWTDESSAAALHYIVRTNRHRALVGILAARDAELRDNSAMQQAVQGLRRAGLLNELRVGPLPAAAVRQLIETHAPAADSERLGRECGGNPLIAIELARAEIDGNAGASLDELIRERLARLDLESAEVLRWAAVLAPRIDIAKLERLTGLDAGRISLALENAERQALLQAADGAYRFAHDLVARSVYTDISPSRRSLMHRRVAELLEQEAAIDLEYAADLAHHASLAGDPALAARAMVSAGHLCLRFYANEEALSLARRGLALTAKLPDRERVCLTIDLENVILKAAPLADWEAAAARYVDLAEQALDFGSMSHARLGYYMASYVRWMHGSWEQARDEMLQAERVARGGSDEDHILGMAEAAKCLALLDRDHAQADAMLMEAQALASRKRIVHHSIPAGFGMLRYHENRFSEAEALFHEARTLAKQAGDRDSEFLVNEHLAMIDIERGAYAEARKRCDVLLEIGAKLREGSEAPFAQALAGVCDYALADDAGSLDEAFAALRDVDAKHRLAYVLTRAAIIDIARERYDLAVARASEALELASLLERATDVMLAHVVLAEASRHLGDKKAWARHKDAVSRLEGGVVAAWVRDRAAAVLSQTKST